MIEQVYFKTSAGVKDIVGRDLITDDFVAVFELVKNSFDALASRVDVVIEEDVIYIVDNGKGMTRDEIMDKWLFLGYSAKQDGQEEKVIKNLESVAEDFRSRIDRHRSAFAGNKGIGRFSCDRLGYQLELFTKSASAGSDKLQRLSVDWRDFEGRLSRRLENIPLSLSHCEIADLPQVKNVPFQYGTILKITGVRSEWDRAKILKLKGSLAKLVNPFGRHDELAIHLHSERELKGDEKAKVSLAKKQIALESNSEHQQLDDHELQFDSFHNIELVNGEVQNTVLNRISKHTTNIRVYLESNGRLIRTEIYDRGEQIVEYSEVNKLEKLYGLDANIEIHFLNRASKTVFTRYMGQHATQFGHIFLFNDGFRVYPVGEPTDDTFKLNQRKTQGHSRFLGTREIIGQINIRGGKKQSFREASSRDTGLVRTPEYEELEKLFMQNCLRPLERYVTGVLWADKQDSFRLDLSGLQTDEARARIINTVANITKSRDVNIVSYSENFLQIIDESSESFSEAMVALEKVAAKLDNKTLSKELEVAKKKHREIEKARRAAQAEAEAHRKARKLAEKEKKDAIERAAAAEADAKNLLAETEQKTSENLFLRSMVTTDVANITSLHHHVGIAALTIDKYVTAVSRKIHKGQNLETGDFLSILQKISLQSRKISATTSFATKANFSLTSEKKVVNICNYIEEYIKNVCSGVIKTKDNTRNIEFEWINELASEFYVEVRPLELTIILDNLINNARKAGADRISFLVPSLDKKHIKIIIADNGKGIPDENASRIFDLGYTTTDGSGLGLHQVKSLIEKEKGTVLLLQKFTGYRTAFQLTFVIK